MQAFKTRYIDAGGRMRSEVLWGDNRLAIRAELKERKCYPQLIEARQTQTSRRFFRTTLKTRDVMAIFDQLEMQLDGGIPIDQGLRNLTRDLPEGTARRVVAKIYERIAANGKVSEAFAAFPRIFPEHVVQVIEVGHKTGSLGPTFRKIGEHMNSADEIKGVVTKAITTPVISFVVILGVVIFLLGFVLPTFAAIFAELGVKLPAITRFYIAAGTFVRGNLVPIFAGMIFIPMFLRWLYSTERVRYLVDRFLTVAPVSKGIVESVVISRFAGNLGTLYEAGVLIQDGMATCSKITGNVVYNRAVNQAIDRIATGLGVGEALAMTKMFPGMMTLSLKVAGETGKLGEALHKIQAYYARRSREQIAVALQFIEPTMLLFSGFFVGSVAISIFYPLVQLGMSIKK